MSVRSIAATLGAWKFEHYVEAQLEVAVEDAWRMGDRAKNILPPVNCLHYDAVTQELFDRYAAKCN